MTVWREERGPRSGQSLLLLHGLAGNALVWDKFDGLLDSQWPGARVLIDLPGHGLSSELDDYSVVTIATAVASTLDEPPQFILGHSLGGAIAIALASGAFFPAPRLVVGIGIKARWTDEESAKAAKAAGFGHRWFSSYEDAAARFLLVSGLSGLVEPESGVVKRGVREEDGKYRPAFDPRAASAGDPQLRSLLNDAQGPVLLARGELDPLASVDDIGDGLTVPSAGHNAHVEAPETLWNTLKTPMLARV